MAILNCGSGHDDLELTRLGLVIPTYPLPKPLVPGGSLTRANVDGDSGDFLEREDEERPASGLDEKSGAELKSEFVKGPWPNVPNRDLVGAAFVPEEVANVTPG